MVRYAKGLAVKGVDRDGRTLAHFAAEEGRVDALEWLKEQGADLNVKDRRSGGVGGTPMHMAARNGRVDAMRWLAENGVDVNAKNDEGQTPMHKAADSAGLEAMKWLHENGADMNAKDGRGNTPMHVAARARSISGTGEGRSDVAAMRWLKEQGADINAKNNAGRTPLEVAIRNGSDKAVVEWLKENGGDAPERPAWPPADMPDVDVQVGDWVMSRMTLTATVTGTPPEGMKELPISETTLVRIQAIEDDMATLDITTTARIPGEEPKTDSRETKVPLAVLKLLTHDLRQKTGQQDREDEDEDGRWAFKVEVLEEGERTVSVNGATFEDVLYQRVRITQSTANQPAWVTRFETWNDGQVTFVTSLGPSMTVGLLKMAQTWTEPTPDGHIESVITMERLAHGRADDPIPEGGDAPQRSDAGAKVE